MDGDGELGQDLIENASPGNVHTHTHHRLTTTLDVITSLTTFQTGMKSFLLGLLSYSSIKYVHVDARTSFWPVVTFRVLQVVILLYVVLFTVVDQKGLQRVRYGGRRVVFQNERCCSGYTYLSQRYQDVLHCRCERSLATSLDGERAFHYHRNGHQQGGQKHHLCRYRWSRGQRALCIVCESSSCMERCENSQLYGEERNLRT